MRTRSDSRPRSPGMPPRRRPPENAGGATTGRGASPARPPEETAAPRISRGKPGRSPRRISPCAAGRAFPPRKGRQGRGANPRGGRHVRSDQAGVRQHGRQGGEQEGGERARRAHPQSSRPTETLPRRRSRKTAGCPRVPGPGCGRSGRRGPECGSLRDTNRGRRASARRRGTAPTRPSRGPAAGADPRRDTCPPRAIPCRPPGGPVRLWCG